MSSEDKKPLRLKGQPAAPATEQAGFGQSPAELAGDGILRVDDDDAGAGLRLDEGAEKWEMGTAEDQRIRARFDQRPDMGLDGAAHRRAAGLSALDELDQIRARFRQDLDALAKPVQQAGETRAGQGARGGEDADHAGTGSEGGRLDRRFHGDHRDRQSRPQFRSCGRRGGVAGDDDGLGAHGHEPVCEMRRARTNEFIRVPAVRDVGGVADVDDVLGRHQATNRSRHGQAADA